MPEHNSHTTNAASQKDNGTPNFWAVLRKYTTVEILMLCYVLPSYLNYIAIQNLALEKSCRVNFAYSDEICDNMIDKTLNNINCVIVRAKLLSQNETHLIKEDVFNSTHFLNGTEISLKSDNKTVIVDLKRLDVNVCQAESDSQGLETALNAFIAPFESALGVIMILFGGSWSDKRGRRKPCMLIPIIGETASLVALLITAVFFKQLPLQFHIILVKILPALCGGIYLMLMGVYSYLTETTAECDRTFRYSIFAQFIQILPILTLPFADILYSWLGYTKLFILCIPINVAGIFYIIFGMKEIERKPTIELKGVDNPTFQNGNETVLPEENGTTRDNDHPVEKKSKGFLRDFFDPTVAIQCINVITKKRKNGEQTVIIFLIVLHFISIGVAQGESVNEYLFTRQKLNWEGDLYALLSSYSSGISFVGTTVVVFFLSKVFECSDPFMGIVGTTMSGIARIFYIIATSSAHMFFGKTFDACAALRALVVRAVLSKFVEASEIGRTFSVLALVESFCAFVYIDLYSYVYTKTLDDWPAAIYLLSLILLAITLIFFVILFFIVKNKEKRDAEEQEEQKRKQKLESAGATTFSGLSETTHL